ncbi:hypothetical protein ACFXDH_20400 [Streptomyces sp. NPDC059467]|uniref:hypothetical protein n=1 Tax=Streptomyces sp. NPDC059467 TaxID=3346844 RepID=UPI0036C39C4A
MARIIRLVAVGSALATGAAVISLPPSASAAEEKSAEDIIGMCNHSAVINGRLQSTETSIGPGFAADNCDFVETDFATFDGPKEKASIDFPNCEANATGPASVNVTWSSTVAQGQGKYTVTQQGGGGGLFGVLSGRSAARSRST